MSEHHNHTDTTIFGFWLYLMSDCLLFATLFATYVVLRGNTFGGPSGKELFDLNFALTETLILLTSSFSCGLAVVALYRNHLRALTIFLGITVLLGAAFVTLELNEFNRFAQEGASWQTSGFLSGFFTLVGTHGAHVTAGIIWMVVAMVQLARKGITATTSRRLVLFSLFWHFLDVIWIFIFTIVYLMAFL